SDGANLDADHGAGTTELSAKDLKALADDPDDFERELQVLAASAGGAPGQAIVTVDGFKNTSRIPPKSAIAFIRINPDLFSAEYETPPYRGGRIEVFTKPGQDTYHGALFFSDSDPSFNAKDPLSITRAPIGKRRYGFELSGPIRRHKSDFALDLEKRDIDSFATVNAFVLNSQGTVKNLIENVATPQRLWIASARTDWQLNSRNTLALAYTGNVSNLTNQGIGGLALPEAGYDGTSNEHDLRITNVATLSPTLLHESRFALSWKDTDQVPLSTAPSLQVTGAFTGGGSTAGELRDHERDIEVDDDLLISHRAHTVKLGVEALGLLVNAVDPDTFNGAFVFGGGSAPSLDAANSGTTYISGLEQYRRALLGLRGGTPTTFNITQGQLLVAFNQWRVAFYAQDQWKLRPRLALSVGLRYALQTSPSSFGNVTPRFGIAWSPDRKSTWVIRARAGLFYAPIDRTTTLQAYRLNGIRQAENIVYGPSFNDPLSGQGLSVITTQQFAPDVSQSPSLQMQLGVEHEFPGHWHAQANLFWAEGWDTLRSRNINAPLVDASTINPLLAPRPLAPNRNIFRFEQSGNLHGPVFFAGLEQHALKRLQLFVGYLYFGLKTDADKATLFPQNSYSNHGEMTQASWEATNRVFGVSQLSLPLKLSLSGTFDSSSGLPYNVTTGTDNNGDGVFNDRPAYAATPGAGVYPTQFGLLTSAGINGGLPRNAGIMPWAIHLDTNLSRSFAVGHRTATGETRQSVTLNARASNLLNHTNVTGVGSVLGSPSFGLPYTADSGRRVEFELRYSF
ncbi:MAG TPA: TonB-dependent receptor, partial [Acidobacteriaceae bacterium]